MSELIENARLRAYERFVAFKSDPFRNRVQEHPNDCVSACFRALTSTASSKQSPADGLSWSETLLEAASYGLYLQPLFDPHLTGLTAILLCTFISSYGDGHAVLIQISNGDPVCVYDPASGRFASFGSFSDKEWTHHAIVYSL